MKDLQLAHWIRDTPPSALPWQATSHERTLAQALIEAHEALERVRKNSLSGDCYCAGIVDEVLNA